MDLGEWVEFIQVLGINRKAIVHEYWFMIVERALVEDVFTRLDRHCKPCFETVSLGGVNATWTHVWLFMFRSHFLVVLAYRGMSAEEVEELGHAAD